MKNVKERAKYDSFELEDNYDFSDGVRGRFFKPKKIPTSMRLDNDILIFLKKQASENKIAYQTLINNLLREYMQVDGLTNQRRKAIDGANYQAVKSPCPSLQALYSKRKKMFIVSLTYICDLKEVDKVLSQYVEYLSINI